MKTFKTINPIPTLAALLLSAGAGLAQVPSPGPAPAPAPGPARSVDAAAEAKFAAADKDKSGTLEGAELDTWKADLARIDLNADAKVTREEFVAAVKAGIVK